MSERADELHTDVKSAFDALRLEAAAIAGSPEMIAELLRQIYHEDELVRYDAAQLLTMLPETNTEWNPQVRRALVTTHLREDSSEIRAMLARRIGEFAALKDHLAFGVLQESAKSDGSVTVRRWCLAAMSRVHPDLTGQAREFLEAQRQAQPDYQADIDAALAALKRRSRPSILAWFKREAKDGGNRLRGFIVVAAAVLLFLFVGYDRLRPNPVQIPTRIAVDITTPVHPAGSAIRKDLPVMVASIARGNLDVPDDIKEFWQKQQPLGTNEGHQQSAIALLSPVDTFVLTDPPEFRWRRKRAGKYYRLRLRDSTDLPLATVTVSFANDTWSADLMDSSGHSIEPCKVHAASANGVTEWTVETDDKFPLKPDQKYRWLVEELNAPSATNASASSDEAGFGVYNPALSKAELADAQSAYAGSHLLLGAFYARYGFIEAARAELKLDPDKLAAARLLKSLNAPP